MRMNYDCTVYTSKKNGAKVSGMCPVSFLEYRYYVNLLPIKGKFLIHRCIKYKCQDGGYYMNSCFEQLKESQPPIQLMA